MNNKDRIKALEEALEEAKQRFLLAAKEHTDIGGQFYPEMSDAEHKKWLEDRKVALRKLENRRREREAAEAALEREKQLQNGE